MKIVIIGSGHLATIFARAAIAAGHQISQVYSQTASHASAFALAFQCEFTTEFKSISLGGDFYLTAIADQGLRDLREQLLLNDRLIVHTAGSLSMDTLAPVSSRYGVLYPLQSLRKEMTSLPALPLLINGNTPESLASIERFARDLSPVVRFAGDRERFKLHLAAVVVNNLTNHLYAMTEEFCVKEAVDFSLLLPLIDETNRRLHELPFSQRQTGPAARGDLQTIQGHLKQLEKYPQLKAAYEELTREILQIQDLDTGRQSTP